jgi:hypothetical protein
MQQQSWGVASSSNHKPWSLPYAQVILITPSKESWEFEAIGCAVVLKQR